MITRGDLDKILREYDSLQLRSAKELQARKAEIYNRIPRLSELDAKYAMEAVSCATAKICGNEEESLRREAALLELKGQRASLLSKYGYSKDPFEPLYVCPKCKDTGYVNGEKCSCFLEKITNILYRQSNLRETLEEENFESFSLSYYSDTPIRKTGLSAREIAAKAYATAKKFVADFGVSSDNLFISGPTGTGKTFLSNCIAKELLDKGYFVFYISAVRFFELLSETSFGNRNTDTKLIEDYIFECDLLIIDDLGTEIPNTFTASRLFDCINNRLLNKKHTIISTNLSLEKLQRDYSERIFSRITNNYIMIKLFGDDIRMQKKLEAL